MMQSIRAVQPVGMPRPSPPARVRPRPRRRKGARPLNPLTAPVARADADIVLRRHPLAELPLILLGCLLTAGAAVLTVRYPASVAYVDLFEFRGFTASVPCALFVLPALIDIVYVVHRLCNFRYIITSDHARAVEGICALRKRDIRIDFENVRGVEVVRTLFQRILTLGDVRIGSAMESEIEISMCGIRHPDMLRDRIMARIQAHFERLAESQGQRDAQNRTREHLFFTD